MGDIYMTKNMGAKIMKLMIAGMAAFMFLIGYVIYQSYSGCERSKLDRVANAKGWRIAQDRALSQGQPWFANQYDKLAVDLENRSRISCITEFPKVGFLR